jgi:NADH-quinone oxidoreductase subunit L
MPITRWTMLIGCIAIAGIPPLAGFFSKDEILWSAFRIGGYGRVVWGIGFVAAAMTAFYMFRLYYMTFHGSFRGTAEQAAHVHESPASMTVPLRLLALGSIVAGFAGVPAVLGGGNWIEHYLHPVFAAAHHALESVHAAVVPGHGVELGLMGASVALAVIGILVATQVYLWKPATADKLAATFSGAHRVLLHKYYVDELYGAVFVRGLALGGGRALHGADRYVVDGGDGEVRPGFGVNGIAWASRDIVAKLSNVWDRFVVDGAVNALAFVLDNLSYLFRAVQNGLVQHYALSMLIGLFLMVWAGRYVLGLY